MKDSDDWVPSVGQRIHAAVVSAIAGYAGVDSTLKKMKGMEPNPQWDALGNMLMHDLVHSLDDPGPLPEPLAKIIPFKK